MGFVRGDQFVEIVAREPKSGTLKFFLIRFKQSCYLDHSCDYQDLQRDSVESGWTDYTIYEDQYLTNTVFDCTHCHQSEGWQGEKKLRMQEIHAPYTHFFHD